MVVWLILGRCRHFTQCPTLNEVTLTRGMVVRTQHWPQPPPNNHWFRYWRYFAWYRISPKLQFVGNAVLSMWSLPISTRLMVVWSFCLIFTFWTRNASPSNGKVLVLTTSECQQIAEWWNGFYHVIWRLDGLLVDWLGIQVEGVPPEAWRFRSQLHPTGDAFSWWQGLGRSYLESSNSFKF